MTAAKTIIKAILAGAIPGGLIISGIYLYNEVVKLKTSCYMMGSFKILKTSPTNVTISLVAKVKNKSDLNSLAIFGQHYDIYLDEQLISSIDSTDTIKLLAGVLIDIPLLISFNPQDVFGGNLTSYLKIATAPDTTKIRVVGYANVGIFGVKLYQLPIEVDYSITEMMAPTPPSAPC